MSCWKLQRIQFSFASSAKSGSHSKINILAAFGQLAPPAVANPDATVSRYVLWALRITSWHAGGITTFRGFWQLGSKVWNVPKIYQKPKANQNLTLGLLQAMWTEPSFAVSQSAGLHQSVFNIASDHWAYALAANRINPVQKKKIEVFDTSSNEMECHQ